MSLLSTLRQRGLIFLSSAFSLQAIDMLQRLGTSAWKVASGEFRSRILLDAMVATGAPILFSTGMMSWAEIAKAVGWLRSKGAAHALLQCTSVYPTPLEQVGLNVLDRLRHEYHCPVGLSDHSGSPFPGLSALARGADIVEVHVTFHRAMFGPDTQASITFKELELICVACEMPWPSWTPIPSTRIKWRNRSFTCGKTFRQELGSGASAFRRHRIGARDAHGEKASRRDPPGIGERDHRTSARP